MYVILDGNNETIKKIGTLLGIVNNRETTNENNVLLIVITNCFHRWFISVLIPNTDTNIILWSSYTLG